MTVLSLLILAQLMAVTAQRPVLAFPDPRLDDPAAYTGYRTRFFRDVDSNTVQIYLDDRQGRVVHLLADAQDESIAFTARDEAGRPAVFRWGGPSANVAREGRARALSYRLVTRGPQLALGWFVLGSMRVERDVQYGGIARASFAGGPYVVPEVARLLATLRALKPVERQRHLALLNAATEETVQQRLAPHLSVRTDGPWTVSRVVQATIDGRDSLLLELRTDARRVEATALGDSLVLRARVPGDIAIDVRILTSGAALTPLSREQIFTPRFLAFLRSTRSTAAGDRRGARLERQVRGLELLVSREKLMAGLPAYATYFGRDMLMTALMMRPIWRPEMSEHVIASALRKLSPSGQVSHEEALGGQAVREGAAEYASQVDSSGRAATAGRQGAADSLLDRARSTLRSLGQVRENYHMIDADLQLPILVARWLGDAGVPLARKRAFLLDSSDGGAPRLRGLLRQLGHVLAITAPYAADPVPRNLIGFAAADDGGWSSQSWRDSRDGYAGGRYAMDVNAIWAPAALQATERILSLLRATGLEPEAMAAARMPDGVQPLLVRYAHDPRALRAAVETWRGASRHFVVRLPAMEVQSRVAARVAALPPDEGRYWTEVLRRTGADRDPLTFLALALDAEGQPIAVENSDPATRLFLGDPDGAPHAPDMEEATSVLRDVRQFARAYPVGLLVDEVGPVAANDAFGPPRVWPAFERDRYHGPRVVWGREVNLFLLGVFNRLADAALPGAAVPPGYVAELRAAADRVDAAARASGFGSELWSYTLRDGRMRAVRYGSGSDVQLWSTTNLVVEYARSRRH